jgi:hypothetical protein
MMLVEVKAEAQPRHVRPALLQLRHAAQEVGKSAVPVLVAPFVSDQAKALCREFDVGYLDFHGNAFLSFGSVYLERSVSSRPPAQQRELKSLYRPKAARVLRAMLNEPDRTWLTTDLAAAAQVSLGHVSNVRTALIEREWAESTSRGLVLKAPGALLDDWRNFYDGNAGKPLLCYTALHSEALDDAVRGALREAEGSGHVLVSSFSAAEWLAPFARVSTRYFVTDESGLRALERSLNLQPASRGENVVVTLPQDEGVFRDAISPAPGIMCTSVIQTYLDLSVAGERGREAADHLRRQKLKW